MLSFDSSEVLNAIDFSDLPSYSISINQRVFKISQLEAKMVSYKINYILKNDAMSDFIAFDIKQNDVFGNIEIDENDFNQLLYNTFEKILSIIRNPSSPLPQMCVKEFCCAKAIFKELDTKSVNLSDEPYRNITKDNAVEILNVLGNQESIKYVSKNLKSFDASEICPNRLADILKSPSLKLKEDDILKVIQNNIKKYGESAYFLLGLVHTSKLSSIELKEYNARVIKYNFHENCDNNNIKTNKTIRNLTKQFKYIPLLLVLILLNTSIPANVDPFQNIFGNLTDMKINRVLARTAWANAYVTLHTFDYVAYGAAQILEYVTNDALEEFPGNTTKIGLLLEKQLNIDLFERQKYWAMLRENKVLGKLAELTFEAHRAAVIALKDECKGNMNDAFIKIHNAIQEAKSTGYLFCNDFNNTINAFKSTYKFLSGNGKSDGTEFFLSQFKGTTPNSKGAQTATIIMSLYSTYTVLKAI